MNVNSIVAYNKRTLGKVVRIDGSKVVIAINEQDTLNARIENLEEISEKIIRFFTGREYQKYFQRQILIRGEQLPSYSLGHISFEKNTFKAIVSGTTQYETAIEFNSNGEPSFRCSCPYGSNCKHEVALAIRLSTIFTKLKKIQAASLTNKKAEVEPSKFLLDFVRLYEYEDFFDATIFKVLDDLIKHDDMEYLIKFYSRFYNQSYYNRDYRALDDAIGNNDQIRQLYYRQESKFRTTRFYNDLKPAMEKGARAKISYDNNYQFVSYSYLFYNKHFQKFMEQYLTNDTKVNSEMLEYVQQNVQITNQLKAYYINYIENDDRSTTVPLKDIFNHLSQKDRVDLLNSNSNLKINYSELTKYSKPYRTDLLKNINQNSYKPTEVFNDISKGVYKNSKLEAGLLQMLYDQDKLDNPKLEKQAISLAKKYNSRYLLDYLTYYDTKGSDFYGNGDFHPEELEPYFAYWAAVTKNTPTECQISIILTDLANRIVVRWELNENGVSLKFNLFATMSNEHTQKLYDYIYDVVEANFADEIKEIKRRKEEKERKEKRDKLLRSIERFNNNVNDSIMLTDNRKAHLDYFFIYRDNQVSLSLKVGIDKMYVVKSMIVFLDKFSVKTTERYGKNLILTHDPDNFEQRDKEVLSLMLLFTFRRDPNYWYYHDSRYLDINSQLFSRMLEMLKGSVISFEDKPYKVTLNKLQPQISIDDNYTLNYSLDNGNYQSVVIGDNVYVFDNALKRIDIIECTRKEKELYRFAIDNNNVEIRYALEEFKDNLYARFQDKIEVSEEIKPDFKLAILQINAYFDYENRTISVATVLKINDVTVAEADITKPDELNKLKIYQHLLAQIGFVDNRITDDSQVLSFFSMDFSNLKDYCTIYLSESIRNKQILRFSPGTVRIQFENNLTSAFLEESEFSDEELEQIIKAIRKKKHYVQLTDDRIIDLEDDQAKEFVELVDDVGLDPKHLSKEKQITMVNALKGYAHSQNVHVDQYLDNMVNEIKNFQDSEIEVPEINGELRGYQVDGYRWLKILSKYHVGGVLADDMGLGKTIQIIALIVSDDTPKPNLIVCPKSLIFNWKNEFARFAPNEKVVEIYGVKEERKLLIDKIEQQSKVTYITSYDSLRNDVDAYSNLHFNTLVIDEAQYIKNVLAQKTEAVKQLEADHKFALTGTPIENNIIDLWSIFDFIMPGYLEKLKQFKSNYNNDDQFTETVRKRISPFILRRTKANVLKDLPEKYETIVTCEMERPQKLIYDAEIKRVQKALNDSDSNRIDILAALTRLRQICVDPATFVDNYTGPSCKMDLLLEQVQNYLAEGHKILIFSSFVKALNIIEERFKENGIDYFIITGATDSRKRIEIANNFNGDSREKVCLISLKAGGTGLNLIGADVVIHLDPWWNVAAENQATDRTHRIGQQKNVEVLKLIVSDSIEQRVIELQNMKKDLIDKLISDDEQSVKGITLEDIKFILN